MAARKRTWTPEIVRSRIRASMLVNRLTKYVRGEIEMQPAQVTAALGLLKKTVPDLSAIEHSGEMSYRTAADLSDALLSDIATGSGEGVAETTDRPSDTDAVH